MRRDVFRAANHVGALSPRIRQVQAIGRPGGVNSPEGEHGHLALIGSVAVDHVRVDRGDATIGGEPLPDEGHCGAALYAEYFPVAPPVRSTPVVQLPRGLLFSIEAIAAVAPGPGTG